MSQEIRKLRAMAKRSLQERIHSQNRIAEVEAKLGALDAANKDLESKSNAQIAALISAFRERDEARERASKLGALVVKLTAERMHCPL